MDNQQIFSRIVTITPQKAEYFFDKKCQESSHQRRKGNVIRKRNDARRMERLRRYNIF